MKKHSRGMILLAIFCSLLVFGMPSFHREGVHAQTTQHGVTVTWTAGTPTTGQVADTSYNVYRSTVSGGPYTKLNTASVTATTYFDSTGVGGTKYFYVITGVASGATESGFSNETSATFLAQAATPGSAAATAN